MQIKMEAACGTLDEALLAADHGIDRIEICAGFAVGGVTPARSTVRSLISKVSVPVRVMVRPKDGAFTASFGERLAMIEEAQAMVDLGADGIVSGVLDDRARIDRSFVHDLRAACPTTKLVFHRVFDTQEERNHAQRMLIDEGWDGLLTSGGPGGAIDNVWVLRGSVLLAGQNMEVVVGGGVDETNIGSLVAGTGTEWVHFSVCKKVGDNPLFGPTFLPDPEKIDRIRKAWAAGR